MPSKITVYNQAAARIGVFDTPINSVTEDTKLVNICNLFYDDSIDYVLAEFPWKFAEKRVTLASLGNPPTNWTYCYAYPTDCIALRYITIPGYRNPRAAQMIPFQVGNNGTVKVIYTDLVDAEVVYTARVSDLNLWGPTAVSALGYYLASQIAMPMSAKPDIAQAAMAGYYREVSRAAANAMNENTLDQPPVNEFQAARSGFGGPADGPLISGGWLP